tara:strand:+ start:1257 stop:1637 length:381 start_codon:yes stop_codon:yes gene_type:complete
MAHQPKISITKHKQLLEYFKALDISFDDIERTTTLGSGKGGQKHDTTKNCIQLHHVPTGVIIKCQANRSQIVNDYIALCRLADKVAEHKGIKTKNTQKIEKLKKQKERRKRRNKQKQDNQETHDNN